MATESERNSDESSDLDQLDSSSDPILRRKIQNRINQREHRRRKALERLKLPKTSAKGSQDGHLRTIAPKPPCDVPFGIQKEPNHELEAVLHRRRILPGILSLEFDPISAVCPALADPQKRQVHEYVSGVLWPGFSQRIARSNETLSYAFWRLSLTSQLSLDSFLWTAALERSLHQDPTWSVTTNTFILESQNRAIQSIRKSVAEGQVTDEVLHAVASLIILPPKAPRGNPLSGEEVRLGAFKSPVKNLGWLQFLGLFRHNPVHVKALKALIDKYGGLKRVTTPGIAEQLQLIDLVMASWQVSAPMFELCDTHQYILDNVVAPGRLPLSNLKAFDVDDDFKELLLDMQMVCQMIDQNEHGDWASAADSHLVELRDLIQYRLLSLPKDKREIARLGALIFSYGTLYPLPSKAPLQRLIEDLQDALNPHYHRKIDCELHFWASMLGGIAAADNSREAFFIEKIAGFRLSLNIWTWNEAKNLLKTFLWLDQACEKAGYDLWTKACERIPDGFL